MIPGKIYQHRNSSMVIMIYNNDPRHNNTKANIIGGIGDCILICIARDGIIRKVLTNNGKIGWIYYCEDRWKEL